MEVRRLTVDDWQANRAIRLEALAECPGNYFTSLAEAQARGDDQWRGMLMSATLTVFGLFDGDALAGIIAINREDGGTATLAMSYIRPEWREQGHSRLLYQARLDWARDHGIGRILVSHRESNTPSRRAIVCHGFRPTGSRPHRWPDGEIADDVTYELALEPVR